MTGHESEGVGVVSTTPNRGVRPAERYGEDQPVWHRVAARAAVIALGLLGFGWVVWAGITNGSQPVTATLVTYETVNASQMRANLDVTMDPGRTAKCTLVAKSVRHLVVGETTVQVGAADRRTQRVVASVSTQEEGASVEVRQCTSP